MLKQKEPFLDEKGRLIKENVGFSRSEGASLDRGGRFLKETAAMRAHEHRGGAIRALLFTLLARFLVATAAQKEAWRSSPPRLGGGCPG